MFIASNYINILKFLLLLLLYITFAFLSFSKLKYLSFTYFDTGYYFELFSKVKDYPALLNNNNLRIILYPLSFILSLLNDKLVFLIIIFFFVSPILFFKKNLSLFCYVLLPTLWFTNINGLNMDVISLPFFAYLISNLEKKFDAKIYFLLLIILSIKSIFILFIIGTLIYGLIKKKINFSPSFILFLLVIFFYTIYYLQYVLDLKIYHQNSIIDGNYFNSLFTIKKLVTLLSLISCTLFLNFVSPKLIIVLPYLIFSFFWGIENYFLFYYHYLLPVYLILIKINDEDGFKLPLKLNNKIYVLILFINHLLLSPSPISITYNFKIKSMYYKNNYFGERNLLMDKKLDELKNTNILISNIFLGSKIYKNNNKISMFYKNEDINDFEYFIFSKKNILFYGDQKCIEQDLKCQINDPIKKKITGIENSVKKISSIFYQDKLILIYRNNKFNK
jgi:hypothetical protein